MVLKYFGLRFNPIRLNQFIQFILSRDSEEFKKIDSSSNLYKKKNLKHTFEWCVPETTNMKISMPKGCEEEKGDGGSVFLLGEVDGLAGVCR